MCHAVASPRSAEYWHIGETTMRFGSVTLRSVSGENKALMGWDSVEREGGAFENSTGSEALHTLAKPMFFAVFRVRVAACSYPRLYACAT
jgi:hypothetical protein